jgi:5-methylcytosine-specific restriction enzyme A
MPILFHWTRDRYRADREGGFEPHLNQNSPNMQRAVSGETCWAFTRRDDGTYVLAAAGEIERVTDNLDVGRYGRFRLWLRPDTLRYFDVEHGGNVEPLLRALLQVATTSLGRSFQGPGGVRVLTPDQDAALRRFASGAAELK